MWPTEYMVHEHRKELQRVAAQVSLVRSAQADPAPQPVRVNRLLNAVFNAIRRLRRPERPRARAAAASALPTIRLERAN